MASSFLKVAMNVEPFSLSVEPVRVNVSGIPEILHVGYPVTALWSLSVFRKND